MLHYTIVFKIILYLHYKVKNETLYDSVSKAENPIFELFLQYGPHIKDKWKMKLLRASSLEAAIRAPKIVSQVFNNVNNELLV